MNVPGFLVRQFYVAGSLRNAGEGFELRARNAFGDGMLVGIGRLSVDGRPIDRAAVAAFPDDGSSPILAADVSRRRPVRFRRGDAITLRVAGTVLEPGEHHLAVELDELNLGRLRFEISDRLAG